MRVIEQAHATDDLMVALRFRGGDVVHYDMKPIIAEDGVWRVLKNPDVFRQVAVAPDGRFISWPGDLDLCADAIWQETHTVTRQP